jgi:hypothetical protein
MQNAADHAAIIHALLAPHISRKVRLNPSPLFVIQPKQVAPHPLLCSESAPEANQQPIHATTNLLGSDPS